MSNNSIFSTSAAAAFESQQDEISCDNFDCSHFSPLMIADAFENNDFWFPAADGSSNNNESDETIVVHATPKEHPSTNTYFEDHDLHRRLQEERSNMSNGTGAHSTTFASNQAYCYPQTTRPMTFSHTLEDQQPRSAPLLAPAGAPDGFVNAFIKVDPIHNTVTLPQQTLQYRNETCAVMDGTLVPIISPADIDRFRKQFLQQQQQQLQGLYYQQLPLFGFPNHSCQSFVQTQSPSPTAASMMPTMRVGGANTTLLPNTVQPVERIFPNVGISPPSLTEPLLSKSKDASPVVETKTTKTTKTTPNEDCDEHEKSQQFKPLPPARPLSAYNFFFRYERERILQYCSDDEQQQPLDHHQWTTSSSAQFQRDVLQAHWARDRTVKRKHRKSHGRISFKALTKRISASWHALPEPAKDVFREIAAQDFQRYSQETLRCKIAGVLLCRLTDCIDGMC